MVKKNPLYKDVSEPSDLQYETINFINKQRFIINKDMLDYLLKEWLLDNSLIFGQYNRSYIDTVSPDVYKSSKISIIMEHDSKFWLNRNILNMAKLYQDHVFYLPSFMDFRGRVYPSVSYLSYQASDISRSLFGFYNVKGFVDLNYLYIYLADVYGKSRVSRKSRIEWATKNIWIMMDVYDRDRDLFNKEYLSKSKEKAQFISCFLSLYAYLKKGVMNIKTPVLFDATCSGIQHLSALTSNIKLGSLVNIMSNDKPNDFYKYCADVVVDAIKSMTDIDMKTNLLKIKIDRSFVKLSVMTIPYNIKLESMSEQIMNKFEKIFEKDSEGKTKLYLNVPAEHTHDNIGFRLTGREAGILCSTIYKSVVLNIEPINDLRKYIHDILKILKILNKPIY